MTANTTKGEQIVIDAIKECFADDIDFENHGTLNMKFGELGIDSMSLLNLHHKIVEKTGISIPEEKLTTISKLGAYIDQQLKR